MTDGILKLTTVKPEISATGDEEETAKQMYALISGQSYLIILPYASSMASKMPIVLLQWKISLLLPLGD